MKLKNAINDYTQDAIFKPGILHGAEHQLYMIYFNGNALEPSWEVCHINSYDVIGLIDLEEALSTQEFLEMLWDKCDWFYSFDEDKEIIKAYPKADFILGRDGALDEEAQFIIDWAKNVEARGV